MAQIRLDKYLADAGVGTRSQVKAYIRKGFICVNESNRNLRPEMKVDPASDTITYQGKPVTREETVYYLLNKPAGYISSTTEDDGPSVLSLIKEPSVKDLFPVGRLDKDTEGLLLITNDGALSHNLLSPKKHVEKEYYVETDLAILQETIALFSQGVDIGDEKPTLPATLRINTETSAYITLSEGRYHQVKRMFHAVGCEVTYLKRIRMGSLTLDASLQKGEYRRLSESEQNALLQTNS